MINLSRYNSDFYKLVGFELLATLLVSIGLLDRIFVYLLLLMVAAFFVTKPFKESLGLFIISLPFYLAIPFFDSMSMWRPLSLLLVLLWLWERRVILWTQPLRFWEMFLRKRALLILTIAISIFIFISTLSLLWAKDVMIGARTIVYFINIFFVLFIYAWEITRNDFLPYLKDAAAVSALSLLIGFLQFAVTFFVPLFVFWQWWALNPIFAYYGARTRNLVAYSNTWFSYYGDDLPATLRMFSFFQDSHAFAMFTILGIAAWGLLFLYFQEKKDKKGKCFSGSIVIISLFAILLSGARGAWAASILLLLTFIFLSVYPDYAPRALTKKALLVIILFFLLFPVSSLLLAGEQKAQLILEGRGEEAASLRLAFLRARSLLDIEEISNKGRLEIWEDSLNFVIQTRTLTGTGIGNFPSVIELTPEKARIGASAHSLYLQFLVELGIFGFLAFLTIIFLILKQSYRILQTTHLRQGFGAQASYKLQTYYAFSFLFAFSWILLYSLVDVTLLNDKVFLYAAILIGILYSMEHETDAKKY